MENFELEIVRQGQSHRMVGVATVTAFPAIYSQESTNVGLIRGPDLLVEVSGVAPTLWVITTASVSSSWKEVPFTASGPKMDPRPLIPPAFLKPNLPFSGW